MCSPAAGTLGPSVPGLLRQAQARVNVAAMVTDDSNSLERAISVRLAVE